MYVINMCIIKILNTTIHYLKKHIDLDIKLLQYEYTI